MRNCLLFYFSQESVIELEYIERQAAPEPEDSLQHDDWVSAIHAKNDWSVLRM